MTTAVRNKTQTQPNQQFKNSPEETLPGHMVFYRHILPNLQDIDTLRLTDTISEDRKGEEAPQLMLELLV